MEASSLSGIRLQSAYNQQLAHLMRAAADLRLHADNEVEELLALDDLGRGLATDFGGEPRLRRWQR